MAEPSGPPEAELVFGGADDARPLVRRAEGTELESCRTEGSRSWKHTAQVRGSPRGPYAHLLPCSRSAVLVLCAGGAAQPATPNTQASKGTCPARKRKHVLRLLISCHTASVPEPVPQRCSFMLVSAHCSCLLYSCIDYTLYVYAMSRSLRCSTSSRHSRSCAATPTAPTLTKT